MSDIKVLVGESHEIKFKVDVEGTTTPVDEIRFTIWAGNLKVSFLGVYGLGVAMFKIQELERFMAPGVYDYFLEVYIINQCFIPFKGKIELAKPVGVSASPVEDVVRGVTIKSSLVAKSLPIESVPEIVTPEIEMEVQKPVISKARLHKDQKMVYVVWVK